MKLGMPLLFEYDNLEDNFKLAKELGFDFVELNLNFPYCREEIEQGKVEELLKKYNLEATLHFYDEADFGLYDEVVDAYISLLDKYLKFCSGYIKLINFHNNAGPVVTISGKKNYIYEKEYDVYIKRLINKFKKVESITDKYRVEMVIENVDSAIGKDFLYRNFVFLNNEGFSFNFDIGHDYIAGEKMYELANKFNFRFGEMHIHDAKENKCHLCLNKGILNIKKFKELAIKNNSYVVLEVKSSCDLKESVHYFNSL